MALHEGLPGSRAVEKDKQIEMVQYPDSEVRNSTAQMAQTAQTAELSTQFFINPATSQPNVSGLILAGSADFKTELSQSDMFDPRLQSKVLNVVDVSYGGEMAQMADSTSSALGEPESSSDSTLPVHNSGKRRIRCFLCRKTRPRHTSANCPNCP